jgi:hypothetical protein
MTDTMNEDLVTLVCDKIIPRIMQWVDAATAGNIAEKLIDEIPALPEESPVNYLWFRAYEETKNAR